MVAPSSSEQVRYDILIEAQQAIKSLQTIMAVTKDNQTKIIEFSNVVLAQSKQWGISWQQALNVYRQLNAELSKQKKATIFGKTGGVDLISGTEKYMSSLEQTGRLTDDVAKKSENMGRVAESAHKKAALSVNALRIALGVLVSMLIFQVIQAFQNMARMAIKGLVEIESAMFNIVNAEKKLSEQGIDITVKGLQQLIKDLQVLNPMLSEFQATELISTLATKVAPALGLGQQEIERLSKSITVLAVRNQALGKSFEEVEQQVITGLLSGRVTAGINQLGVKITDQIVQEEALRLGLVRTTEEYRNLNAKEQERINALSIISILEQNTAQEAQSLPVFLQTASGLIGVAKAEFQDLLTSLGQKFAPLLKEILRGIIAFLERINQSLTENEEGWNAAVTLMTIGAKAATNLALIFLELALKIGEAGKRLYAFLGALPILRDVVKKLFPEEEFADTPTAGVFNPEGLSENGEKAAEEVQKAEDKISDIMKEARDKRLDIERDYQNKLEDINRDYSNKLIDIARDTQQKREDALRDYNQKVDDINRDTAQSIAEAQEDAHQQELENEQQFQQDLKELREKFLFDLEDALHERDARQILRLIRQYNRDKNNLQERHDLERQEAAVSLQIRIEELERERQLKLEAARREYEEKLLEIGIGEQRALEEAGIWKRRQLEDARIWHQRQLQEQREFLKRKLQDVATALNKELGMNANAAQALAGIWGNAFSGILTGFNASIADLLSPNIGTGGAIVGGSFQNAAAGWAAQAQTWTNSGMYGTGGGFREGGSLLATKPTTATFGEVPELVTFTPLSGRGENIGKMFGSGPGASGGEVEILLTLSPDLEARIVNKSMEETANVVLRLNRTKV